jgi:hypothetical protein
VDFFLIPSILAVVILALVGWNVLAWPKAPETAASHPQSVSVLIPARNEEFQRYECR